ncbi:MAG: helix-turn-helix transcriptional regulator [Nitrospira sp.]
MSGNRLQAIPSVDELLSDLTKVASLPPEVATGLWADIRTLEKALVLRMITSAAAKPLEDRLISIDEAASILGMSKDRLYRKEYPFTVREGGLLRFSSNGIQKYIHARLHQR